jgi:IS30 family transposase
MAEDLSLSERVEIQTGIAAEESARTIAKRLNRQPSTICRELGRNGGREGYSALEAHRRAWAKAKRPRPTVFEKNPMLADHVTGRLDARDSPMTIAKELAQGVYPGVGATVSHQTIYDAVYANGTRGIPEGRWKCLHRRRRRPRPRAEHADKPATTGPLGDFALIHDRPPAAAQRAEIGHLEGDLICGAANRSAIVTLVDRCCRKLWLADLPNGHGADDVLAALVEILDTIPEALRRTLTWDQGREMARHRDLAALVGIDVFFADAHSPWQRPTNENTNGLIRRYVGKGTNLAVYTPDDLRAIEHRINTMPRRSLAWNTANNLYHAATVALTA